MVRAVNSANKTQAESSNQYPVDFVEIIINNTTTVRYSNWHGDITFNSNTYIAAGNFLSFSGTSEDLRIKDNPLNITLSGVVRTFLNSFLTNTIEGSKVTVYRGWIGTTGSLVATPDERWGGFISASNVQDVYGYSEDDTITLTIECRSLLETILNRKNGRFTSVESFQMTNANDQSMEFVAEMNTKEFLFGVS